MKKSLHKSFLIWLPFAAMITFVCGLSYVLVQQSIRMAANDPQVSIVADIKADLAAGATAADLIPPGQAPVDIATSLDPYVAIFDGSGTMLASSGMLAGQAPVLPIGAFAYAQAHDEDRFTWQPEPGVRGAVVLDYVDAGPLASSSFVLAGRSLMEPESWESNLLHITEIAWILGLIVMFGIVWGMGMIKKD